jgi:hypothetical protein
MIDSYLLKMGFEKSEVEPNVYYIFYGEDTHILILYHDELFTIGGEELIFDCKRDLSSYFEMKYI